VSNDRKTVVMDIIHELWLYMVQVLQEQVFRHVVQRIPNCGGHERRGIAEPEEIGENNTALCFIFVVPPSCRCISCTVKICHA
jgi:hypothetical protein